MDASKLRNVLIDLSDGYETKINSELESLYNNMLVLAPDKIDKDLEKIRKLFYGSVVERFTPSNLEILEKIGGTDYYGIQGYNEVIKIFEENKYNTKEISSELISYTEKRKEFLDKISTVDDHLKELNIPIHYHYNNIFEIGLLLPKKVTNNKIVNVTRELNKWDKVIKTIRELTANSIDDTEINFVNNGSLQFFIDNAPEVALCISIIVERIAKLYSKLLEIKAAKEKLEQLGGLPVADKKTVEKQEKDIFNGNIDQITQDILKEFTAKQVDKGRVNELKVAMKGHVIYVAKCMDNGITIEINPPDLQVPSTVEENDTEEKIKQKKELKESYDAALKKIELVQKSTEAVKTIAKTGIDIVKYLTNGSEVDDDSTETREVDNSEDIT